MCCPALTTHCCRPTTVPVAVNMQLHPKYSAITNRTLHNFLLTIQTFQWWMSAAPLVFKLNATTTHENQSLFRNDRIALSVNSSGKSFHIDSKAVCSSAMLGGFGINFWQRPSIAPHTIINGLRSGEFCGQSFFFNETRTFNLENLIEKMHI